MNKLVAFLVLLAVLATASFFLLSDDSASEAPPPTPERTSQAPGAVPDGKNSEAPGADAPDGGLATVPFVADASADLVLPRILVVDGEGQPAAQVPVHFHRKDPAHPVTRVRSWELKPLQTRPPEHTVRTDETGLAQWPAGAHDGHWTIVPETDRQAAQAIWDFARITDEQRERHAKEPITFTLRLLPYRDLDVQVLDEDGEPVADAIVAAHTLGNDAFAPTMIREDMSSSFESFRTGADGRAALRMPETGRKRAFGATGRLRFYVLQIGGKPTAFDVEGDALDQPIVVRVQGLCRATITAQGLPEAQADRARTKLTMQQGDPPRGSSMHVNYGGLPPGFDTAAEGLLRAWAVSDVADRQELAIFQRGATIGWRLDVPGHAPQFGQWSVPDAKAAEFALEMGEALLTYTLVVKGEDDVPIQRDWYHIGPRGLGSTTRLDREKEQWTFRVPAATKGPLTFHRAGRHLDWNAGPEASVALPGGAPGETVDLGTITLPVPPLFVEGRVEDHDGQPVGPLSLRVKTMEGKSMAVFGLRDYIPWRIPVSKDGRFSIRRWAPTDSRIELPPLSLRAESKELTSAKTPFEVGGSVVVVASPSGALAGSITVPQELMEHVEILLVTDEQEFPKRLYTAGRGAFEERGLIPGLYSLVVKIGEDEGLRIDNLLVAPGETARPTALQDLHVGAGYRLVDVKVVGPDGKPLREVSVEVAFDARPDRFGFEGLARTNDRGETQILIPEGRTIHLQIDPPRSWRRDKPQLATRHFKNPEFPLTVQMDWEPNLTLILDRPLPAGAPLGWSVLLSRPFDAASRERAEREAEERRKNLDLSPEVRARTRVKTHEDYHGNPGKPTEAGQATFRFGSFMTAEQYELRVVPKRARGEAYLEPVTLGTIDVPHGEHTVNWQLTDEQLLHLKQTFGW